MGKKPIISVTYENEKVSIKNSLPYMKCRCLPMLIFQAWATCGADTYYTKVLDLLKTTFCN